MFYWSINIGAALSSFAMPLIRKQWGYAIAFLFPAALMVIAFAIFALGKRFYAVEVISRTPLTPKERSQRWVVLGRIVGLFVVVAFFGVWTGPARASCSARRLFNSSSFARTSSRNSSGQR